MAILSILIQISGATLLLLFAVRMVRTGIERAFGPRFTRAMTSGATPLRLIPIGVVMAMVLQRSGNCVKLCTVSSRPLESGTSL